MRVSRVSMDRFFYIYKFLHLILEPLEIPPAPFLPPSLFFFLNPNIYKGMEMKQDWNLVSLIGIIIIFDEYLWGFSPPTFTNICILRQ